jgi:simple sugar transport system ATP-binding protein
MTAPIVECRNLDKWYSGVHALKNVSLSVKHGEVLGLVGDNGAGKSTLIKLLSGVHRPDKGGILIDGRPVEIKTPKAAMRLGIETIYQYNSMVPTMSIARNLFIGREPLLFSIGGIGLMDQKRMARESVALQVEAADPRRTHKSSLCQGNRQSDQLRQGTKATGRHWYFYQPQHASCFPIL